MTTGSRTTRYIGLDSQGRYCRVNEEIGIAIGQVGGSAPGRGQQVVEVAQPGRAVFELFREVGAEAEFLTFQGDLEHGGQIKLEGAAEDGREGDLAVAQRADETGVRVHGGTFHCVIV